MKVKDALVGRAADDVQAAASMAERLGFRFEKTCNNCDTPAAGRSVPRGLALWDERVGLTARELPANAAEQRARLRARSLCVNETGTQSLGARPQLVILIFTRARGACSL